jgi:spermidine/putrescine transport system permease protein
MTVEVNAISTLLIGLTVIMLTAFFMLTRRAD